LLICEKKEHVPVVGKMKENPNIVPHVSLKIAGILPKRILISALNVKNIPVHD
jgi:hypothetical protein